MALEHLHLHTLHPVTAGQGIRGRDPRRNAVRLISGRPPSAVFGAASAVLAVLLLGAFANRVVDQSAMAPDSPRTTSGIVGPNGKVVAAEAYFHSTRSEIEARLGPPAVLRWPRRGRWIAYRVGAVIVDVRYSPENVADRVMVLGNDTSTRVDMMPRPQTYGR